MIEPAECVEAAALLLYEAEVEAIGNPTRADILLRLADEWRALADSLISMMHDG